MQRCIHFKRHILPQSQKQTITSQFLMNDRHKSNNMSPVFVFACAGLSVMAENVVFHDLTCFRSIMEAAQATIAIGALRQSG